MNLILSRGLKSMWSYSVLDDGRANFTRLKIFIYSIMLYYITSKRYLYQNHRTCPSITL